MVKMHGKICCNQGADWKDSMIATDQRLKGDVDECLNALFIALDGARREHDIASERGDEQKMKLCLRQIVSIAKSIDTLSDTLQDARARGGE
jgi:hypothetical protein